MFSSIASPSASFERMFVRTTSPRSYCSLDCAFDACSSQRHLVVLSHSRCSLIRTWLPSSSIQRACSTLASCCHRGSSYRIQDANVRHSSGISTLPSLARSLDRCFRYTRATPDCPIDSIGIIPSVLGEDCPGKKRPVDRRVLFFIPLL